MLRDRLFLEGPKQEFFERRQDVSKHVEREDPVERCTMDFPSWSITVKRRRSNRGKEKITTESQLAPFSMGAASNMNLEEMMDMFFANIVYTGSDDEVFVVLPPFLLPLPLPFFL